MKIKKISKNNYRLLKTYLMLSQVYLNDETKSSKQIPISLLNKKIEIIELYLKKALKIIFEYHFNKQKILFIGSSSVKKTFLTKILNNTNHEYVDIKSWIPGIFKCWSIILQQPLDVQKNPQKNQNLLKKKKSVFKFYEKPKLIVITDIKIMDDFQVKLNIFKEIYQQDVPVISFNKDHTNFLNKMITYKLIGNYVPFDDNTFSTQFPNFLIHSILKKNKNKSAYINNIN